MTSANINAVVATYLGELTTEQLEENYWHLLSSNEKQLYQNRHSEKRKIQFIVSRILIKTVIKNHLNITPQDIEIIYESSLEKSLTKHSSGKPLLTMVEKIDEISAERIAQINISISHTDNHIVCAINNTFSNIGIDIERHDKSRSIDAIINKYFSHDEKKAIRQSHCQTRSFYRLWCIKESLYKMSHCRENLISLPHRTYFEFNHQELIDGQKTYTTIKYNDTSITVHWPIWQANELTDYTCCYLHPLSNEFKNHPPINIYGSLFPLNLTT